MKTLFKIQHTLPKNIAAEAEYLIALHAQCKGDNDLYFQTYKESKQYEALNKHLTNHTFSALWGQNLISGSGSSIKIKGKETDHQISYPDVQEILEQSKIKNRNLDFLSIDPIGPIDSKYFLFFYRFSTTNFADKTYSKQFLKANKYMAPIGARDGIEDKEIWAIPILLEQTGINQFEWRIIECSNNLQLGQHLPCYIRDYYSFNEETVIMSCSATLYSVPREHYISLNYCYTLNTRTFSLTPDPGLEKAIKLLDEQYSLVQNTPTPYGNSVGFEKLKAKFEETLLSKVIDGEFQSPKLSVQQGFGFGRNTLPRSAEALKISRNNDSIVLEPELQLEDSSRKVLGKITDFETYATTLPYNLYEARLHNNLVLISDVLNGTTQNVSLYEIPN